jgi:hypothetical protein
LHLPSHKIIIPHHLSAKEKGIGGEYIDDSQGYAFGIKKIISDFKGIKTLSVLPRFEDETRCSWHSREIRTFRSQYYALKPKTLTNLGNHHEAWPLFESIPAQYGSQSDTFPEPARDNLLTLRWSRVEKNPRIVQFTVSLYEKTRLKNTISYFIVTDMPRYQACAPVKKVVKPQVKKLKLTIKTFKRHYKIGEKLRFIVSANQTCELNIIYKQADGKMVLLPYYYNKKPFVGDYLLKAGETRIIPVHPNLNIDITGSTGTASLFIQCKVGGLGERRIDQDALDRLHQGISGNSHPFAKKEEVSEKHKYDGKLVKFFVE